MRRWAAWLDGLALAIGGIFLVKSSIEPGYFGSAARVTAGLLLGLVLLGASGMARRKPLAAPLGPVPVDYVPAALAAATLAVLFASLCVAYAVFDLIGPFLAFALLARGRWAVPRSRRSRSFLQPRRQLRRARLALSARRRAASGIAA